MTSRMFSTMTSLGMWRSMCTVSGELVEQGESNWDGCDCEMIETIRTVIKNATIQALYVIESISWFRRSGASVTLVTREDWKVASELITILERSGQVNTPAGIHSFHYVYHCYVKNANQLTSYKSDASVLTADCVMWMYQNVWDLFSWPCNHWQCWG